MDSYQILKTLHILSATLLFGTGLGTAFFMFRTYSTHNIHEKYYAARNTVLADYLFTFPAVILQPLTGIWLLSKSGHDWASSWLILSYALYAIAGLCWLPVVWLQIQLKNMLATSVQQNVPLPDAYHSYFKLWFLLGWPAFISLLIIFFLMVIKPS